MIGSFALKGFAAATERDCLGGRFFANFVADLVDFELALELALEFAGRILIVKSEEARVDSPNGNFDFPGDDFEFLISAAFKVLA